MGHNDITFFQPLLFVYDFPYQTPGYATKPSVPFASQTKVIIIICFMQGHTTENRAKGTRPDGQ
jgi:hypothetical protein